MSDASLDGIRTEALSKINDLRDAGCVGFDMRSCWNCNGAHEHLRDNDLPIWCFDCGRWFYKGIDITVDEVSP